MMRKVPPIFLRDKQTNTTLKPHSVISLILLMLAKLMLDLPDNLLISRFPPNCVIPLPPTRAFPPTLCAITPERFACGPMFSWFLPPPLA